MRPAFELDTILEELFEIIDENDLHQGEMGYLFSSLLTMVLLNLPKSERQRYVGSIIEATQLGLLPRENEIH